MKSNTYIFLLSSRYPTEKAYGVTTACTVNELRKLGKKAEIWAPGSESFDTTGNPVTKLLSPKSQFLINYINRKSEKIGFKVQILFCLISAIKRNKKNPDNVVFWVRDPYLCIGLFLLTRSVPILFEMHFPVGKVKTKILSIGVNRHRIAIGALTKVHLEEIRKSSSLFGSFILPMAAPDYLFEIGHDRLREIPEFPVIGYLGKATSSGHSNGLIDFLNQIKAAQDRGLEVRFWFAGIESQNIEELSTRARELGIEKKYLKISGHVPHEMVSKILSEFDFGLIPYPESTYNSYRFPIKSVEYAASQIPIIATTTTSNLHILNPRISLFYDPNTPLDFVLKLEDILNNPSRIVALRQNALTWATSHTYQNRVLVASDAIRHLINVED